MEDLDLRETLQGRSLGGYTEYINNNHGHYVLFYPGQCTPYDLGPFVTQCYVGLHNHYSEDMSDCLGASTTLNSVTQFDSVKIVCEESLKSETNMDLLYSVMDCRENVKMNSLHDKGTSSSNKLVGDQSLQSADNQTENFEMIWASISLRKVNKGPDQRKTPSRRCSMTYDELEAVENLPEDEVLRSSLIIISSLLLIELHVQYICKRSSLEQPCEIEPYGKGPSTNMTTVVCIWKAPMARQIKGYFELRIESVDNSCTWPNLWCDMNKSRKSLPWHKITQESETSKAYVAPSYESKKRLLYERGNESRRPSNTSDTSSASGNGTQASNSQRQSFVASTPSDKPGSFSGFGSSGGSGDGRDDEDDDNKKKDPKRRPLDKDESPQYQPTKKKKTAEEAQDLDWEQLSLNLRSMPREEQSRSSRTLMVGAHNDTEVQQSPARNACEEIDELQLLGEVRILAVC